MLEKIAQYRAMPSVERLKLKLGKYLCGGYLDFVMEWGRFDSQLAQVIQQAVASLEKGSTDAEAKTEHAIFALKSKGVP